MQRFRSRLAAACMAVISLAFFTPQSALGQVTDGQTWEAEQLGDATIDLDAYWEPMSDAVYEFDKKPQIRELKVATKRLTRRSSDFQPFLPEQTVQTGDAWQVDPELVVPILKQFHEGARAELHHGFVSAPGGWACLSALNDEFAEISFRIHAEFLLDGDGNSPDSSWFTPAQFKGRLLIDITSNQVVAFQMGVPSQSANVDINLPIGADIGRIPRMELVGGTFPEALQDAGQISDLESRQLLARKFYPFAEVDWLSLDEARAESLETGKPLHVIALFGSLDDESC